MQREMKAKKDEILRCYDRKISEADAINNGGGSGCGQPTGAPTFNSGGGGQWVDPDFE